MTLNINTMFSLFKHMTIKQDLNADLYIASKQISQDLITSDNIRINDDLIYEIKDNEYTIYLDNNRIVKTPGFEIFAFDVEELSFELVNELIYMNIQRDNKNYSFLIGAIYDSLK